MGGDGEGGSFELGGFGGVGERGLVLFGLPWHLSALCRADICYDVDKLQVLLKTLCVCQP